jgi:GMP synthase-like glutamine amidotransferase
MIALAPSHKNQLKNYTSWLEKRNLPYQILKTGDKLENFRMLILCGGPDVGKLPVRDKNEFGWLKEAYGKIPVLGICRGMQISNIFLGGTLHEDLPDSPISHTADKKMISGEPQPILESRWHTVQLNDKEIKVNSRHHQGVQEIGSGLTPLAVCEDGLIEMMEGQKSLFVQWHPERPEVWNTDAEKVVYEWIEKNYKKYDTVELILEYMRIKGFTVISEERVKKLDSSCKIEELVRKNSRTFKKVLDKKGRSAIKYLKS